MEIEEYVNEIMKPWIHDRKPNIDIKKALNSVYGKRRMYEQEYIANDARQVLSCYMFNRCCGKTWWLNSHYIDTDTVTKIQESETRTMARTHLSIDTKIRIQFRRLNRKGY